MALHSTGDLDPDAPFHSCTIPEEMLIQSFGSGYGGNALLGKKCHALRIASWQARDEGWLAEHMLLMEVESPERQEVLYRRGVPVCLRQDQPGHARATRVPGRLEDPHARRRHRMAARRRLRDRCAPSIPEAGYFGVVPGTNEETNRTAFEMIQHNAIFTNVAVTADNEALVGRQENRRARHRLEGSSRTRAAMVRRRHPNSRFTVVRHQQSEVLTTVGTP